MARPRKVPLHVKTKNQRFWYETFTELVRRGATPLAIRVMRNRIIKSEIIHDKKRT